MTIQRCSQTSKAEALHDGRLSDAVGAAYLEHAQDCAACTAEMHALVDTDTTMRLCPALETSPAQTQRAKVALISRVDDVRKGEPRAKHAYLMFVVAVFVVGLFFIERNYLRSGDVQVPIVVASQTIAVPIAPATTPLFEVANVDNAVWETTADGGTVRGSLLRGVASFHVVHLEQGQRFLVTLPDGELEVHGTRFVVDVHDSATRSVDVSEGVVALRLNGQPELFLHAGERWPRAPSGVVPVVLAPVHSPAPSAQPLGLVPKALDTTPKTPDATSPAAARFIEAARSFQSGSYATADAQLGQFIGEFPNDPRCEDAAFMRIVAHSKMGDQPGAATLAREYLGRYPLGLRRREVEDIANTAAKTQP